METELTLKDTRKYLSLGNVENTARVAVKLRDTLETKSVCLEYILAECVCCEELWFLEVRLQCNKVALTSYFCTVLRKEIAYTRSGSSFTLKHSWALLYDTICLGFERFDWRQRIFDKFGNFNFTKMTALSNNICVCSYKQCYNSNLTKKSFSLFLVVKFLIKVQDNNITPKGNPCEKHARDWKIS